jgi:hypothetical protein
MSFLRMFSVWECAAKSSHNFEHLEDQVRVVDSNFSNIYMVHSNHIRLDDVKSKYTALKRMGLRCRSIKFFFNGAIPDLTEKGLIHKGITWHYPHDQIGIGAVPYGENEWCFMIEKRNGAGVPLHALNFVPRIEHQIEWREFSHEISNIS